MNFINFKTTIHSLLKQRSALLIISMGLLVSNIILSIKLLSENTRVIITPPEIQKSFWVDQGTVSPEYLEQMSTFIAHQILDVSPASAQRQREIVLGYVAPEFHNALKKRLEKEEAFLRKEQVSTSFKPTQITVDAEKLEVELIGEMNHYVASARISHEAETYLLKFLYKGQRLHLKSFKLKGDIDE
jgi:conjugal transfer pilus assembly protein TraE